MAKRISKFLFYGVIYIIVFILLLGIDLMRLSLDWDKLTPRLIYDKALLSVLFTFLAFITSLFTFDLYETDDDYRELESALSDYAIKLSGEHFTETIGKLSWYDKKKAWIQMIDIKIFNHENKISKKVAKELFHSHPDDYSQKTIKYLEKRDKLREMLTDEWINKNLYLLKINYEEIHANEVLYGQQKYKSKNSKLVRKPVAAAWKNKLFLFLPSLIGSVLFSILSEGEKIKNEKIIGLIALILIILMNTFTGFWKGRTAHKMRVMNSKTRLEIVNNYMDGVYDDLEEVPKKLSGFKLPDKNKNKKITIEEIETVEKIDMVEMEIIEEQSEEEYKNTIEMT